MPPFSYKSKDIGVAGRHTMNNNNNNKNNQWNIRMASRLHHQKGILVHVAMAG